MSIDDFANCYANRVGTTVDAVIDDLRKIGEGELKQFMTWFRGLGDADRALVLFLAGTLTSVLLKICTKAVGETPRQRSSRCSAGRHGRCSSSLSHIAKTGSETPYCTDVPP